MLFKKIRGFLYNLNIFNKLILSYFFTAIIPVILIGLLSYNVATSHIKRQGIDILHQVQEKYQVTILNNLSKYQLLCDNIYYDQKLQNYLLGRFFGINPDYYFDQYTFITNYFIPKLQSSFAFFDSNLNISIINYNDNIPEVITPDFDGILNSGSSPNDYIEVGNRKTFQIYNIERAEKHQWFKELKDTTKNYKWVQVNHDHEFNNISLAREIFDFNTPGSNSMGLLKLTVRLEDIFGQEEVSSSPQNSFSLFIDENNVLLSPEKEKHDFYEKNKNIVNDLLEGKSNGEHIQGGSILLMSTIPSTNWKMISIYPVSELVSSAKNIRDITFFSCLISLLILFAVTYRVSLWFSNRITNISRHMTAFQNEDITLESRLHDKYKDELGYLVKAFNNMSDRINTLITDVYQANIDKKEFELKALQAQINPHFLYNSLSAINRLASSGDVSKVDYMVKNLTKFYRMTLSNGRNNISIAEELEQVKAYIDIYNIRKRNFFNVHYVIDEEATKYSTIKIILQPFVENIFEHAIYNRKHPINISIKARKTEGNIVFNIIDDGIGMETDIIESILTHETSHGYGIKNVNERIKLQYGDSYGIEIFSRSGIGTNVTITIPAIS